MENILFYVVDQAITARYLYCDVVTLKERYYLTQMAACTNCNIVLCLDPVLKEGNKDGDESITVDVLATCNVTEFPTVHNTFDIERVEYKAKDYEKMVLITRHKLPVLPKCFNTSKFKFYSAEPLQFEDMAKPIPGIKKLEKYNLTYDWQVYLHEVIEETYGKDYPKLYTKLPRPGVAFAETIEEYFKYAETVTRNMTEKFEKDNMANNLLFVLLQLPGHEKFESKKSTFEDVYESFKETCDMMVIKPKTYNPEDIITAVVANSCTYADGDLDNSIVFDMTEFDNFNSVGSGGVLDSIEADMLYASCPETGAVEGKFGIIKLKDLEKVKKFIKKYAGKDDRIIVSVRILPDIE